MYRRNYTEQQMAALEKALAAHGVALPKDIEIVTSGGFGVCFVGKDEVLKLFKTSSSPDRAKFLEKYFGDTVKAYMRVSDVADIITERGVQVPRLIGSGRFLFEGKIEPIRINEHDQFHAWQRMTKVEGKHLLTPDAAKLPRALLQDRQSARALAQVAAKIHVKADAADKKIDDYRPKFRNYGIDRSIASLFDALAKDIKTLTRHSKSVTLLHGDFFQGNVLKSAQGKYAVIDWDQQKFGRPEQDFLDPFHRQPKRIAEYCDLYNATATQRIDKRLVAAYSLESLLVLYQHQWKFDREIRNSKIGRRKFSVIVKRIIELSRLMHQWTGKKAYVDAARDFSSSQNPPGRPVVAKIKSFKLTPK